MDTTDVSIMFSKLRTYDIVLFAFIILASTKLIQYLLYRSTSRLAKLKGPSNTSILFGRSTEIIKSLDRSAVYEQWANQYGAVYKIPTAMGGTRVVICDPKAISHILAKDTYTYIGVPLFRKLMTKFVSVGYAATFCAELNPTSLDPIC